MSRPGSEQTKRGVRTPRSPLAKETPRSMRQKVAAKDEFSGTITASSQGQISYVDSSRMQRTSTGQTAATKTTPAAPISSASYAVSETRPEPTHARKARRQGGGRAGFLPARKAPRQGAERVESAGGGKAEAKQGLFSRYEQWGSSPSRTGYWGAAPYSGERRYLPMPTPWVGMTSPPRSPEERTRVHLMQMAQFGQLNNPGGIAPKLGK